MMRPNTAKTSRALTLAWTAAFCLLVTHSGCQLAGPRPIVKLTSKRDTKLASTTSENRKPVNLLDDNPNKVNPTAVVRAQSPQDPPSFAAGAANGDDYYRSGMGVTNATGLGPQTVTNGYAGGKNTGVSNAAVGAAGTTGNPNVSLAQYQQGQPGPAPGVYNSTPYQPQYNNQYTNQYTAAPQNQPGQPVNRYLQQETLPSPVGQNGFPQTYPPADTYGSNPAFEPIPQYGATGGSMGTGVFNPGYDENIPQIYGPDGGINYSPELGLGPSALPAYQPRIRDVPIDVYVQEARTGRIVLGGSVNSDLGVAGQVIVDEQNFDLFRPPTSFRDLFGGRAFRGGGQNFRLELMPGVQVQRYTVNWTERNLFGYMPVSLSVGGFYFTRFYRDWNEQRLGGRVSLGYNLTQDLAISSELRAESVTLSSPRVAGVPELDRALGQSDMFTGRFRLAHDTRDSPFMATQGHLLELIYDQVFGTFNFPRANINYHKYFLLRERPDRSGRHILASILKFGFAGSDVPIYENYFAGGYSTMRGFRFRGASPVTNDVQVGGRFMMLGSLEYVFPITADDMLKGIAFVDYGTVERNIEINKENFRIAPGFGFRVNVPALGPAPLAFDFAFPIASADTDQRQVFSFFMGYTR